MLFAEDVQNRTELSKTGVIMVKKKEKKQLHSYIYFITGCAPYSLVKFSYFYGI